MSGVITKYLWTFGDGETSNEKEPVHVYRMPGVYTVKLEVWDDDGTLFSETKVDYIYVYENSYAPGGRNVTKSDRIYRLGVPQEKKQGISWSEYQGIDYPNAIGLVGTCKIFDNNDEERIIVTDCDSFKHYWLGKEDHWLDGGNENYGGSEIESDILFREHVPPIEATAKLRHSESHANLKPWYKDRRNTGDYNTFGFRNNFKSSMYFREDSSPEDRAVVKYFPRKAQIVSDRHIESESIQAGLRLIGAPWRLVNMQQWYEQIDTAAAPPEKQMSEKTWAELMADSIIWIGRSIELVSLEDGSHKMPWDKGSNQRTTGSFSGVIGGPDGNTRSAIVFNASESMSVDTDLPSGDMSIVLWVKSPASSCTIISNANLTIKLINSGDGWNLDWDDGVNNWKVALSAALTQWTMITIIRHETTIEVYENKSFVNTRFLKTNRSYVGPIEFYSGSVIGFEPRIVGSILTADAIEWLYNDVIENQGKSTCAMY
jgi:PKD repeat protein